MGDFDTPNVFVSGEVISSAEVNENFSNIEEQGNQLQGSRIDVVDYGSNLTSADVNTALTAISTAQKELVHKAGSWAFSTTVTYPTNVTPVFDSGAVVTISAGTTTIKQQPVIFHTGCFVVSGSGAIRFSDNVNYVDIMWFKTSTNTLVDALAAACTAVTSTAIPVFIPAGVGAMSYDPADYTANIVDFRSGAYRSVRKIDPMPGNLFSLAMSNILNTYYVSIIGYGDSLIANRHPFFSATEGDDDSYDYFPGGKSPYYQVRDALIMASPGWKTVNEMMVLTSGNVVAYTDDSVASELYECPFEGFCKRFTFTNNGDALHFNLLADISGEYFSNLGDFLNMYILGEATNYGTFSVDVYNARTGNQIGTTITGFENESDGTYKSRELKYWGLHAAMVNVPIKVVITRTSASPATATLDICGFSRARIQAHFTGKGSQTSAWGLANVATRVNAYDPDIVFLTFGANDTTIGAAATYTNVLGIVNSIRSNKANTKIIIVSPPPHASVSDGLYRDITNSLQRVAEEKRCGFINLMDLFDGVNPTVYRYDSIHLTGAGCDMVADEIIRRYFSNCLMLGNSYHHGVKTYNNNVGSILNTPARYKIREQLAQEFEITWVAGTSSFSVATTSNLFTYPKTYYFLPITSNSANFTVTDVGAYCTIDFKYPWYVLNQAVPIYRPLLYSCTAAGDKGYQLRYDSTDASANTIKFEILKLNAGTGVYESIGATTDLADGTKFRFVLG